MDEIVELLENGQWTNAMQKFKRINISGKEMGDYLDYIKTSDTLRDIALLGFYSREFKPKDKK